MVKLKEKKMFQNNAHQITHVKNVNVRSRATSPFTNQILIKVIRCIVLCWMTLQSTYNPNH